MDLREHGGHALRRRRRRGQEAQLAVVLLLVRAVGDEAVQVNVEAEVAAEALYDREHARVQGRDRGQAVLLLHATPHVLHHRPRQPPGDGGQQRRVVAKAAPPSGPGTTAPTADNPPPAARGPPATPRPRPSAGPCTRDSIRATCRRTVPAARRRNCGSRSVRSRARSPRSPRSPPAPPSRTPAAAPPASRPLARHGTPLRGAPLLRIDRDCPHRYSILKHAR